MVRKKGFRLKGFISLEDINLSRQKRINHFICLINHGIFTTGPRSAVANVSGNRCESDSRVTFKAQLEVGW